MQVWNYFYFPFRKYFGDMSFSNEKELLGKFCPICSDLGLTSNLVLFKINFSKAICLCPSEQVNILSNI